MKLTEVTTSATLALRFKRLVGSLAKLSVAPETSCPIGRSVSALINVRVVAEIITGAGVGTELSGVCEPLSIS